MTLLLLIVGSLIFLVIASFGVEALRQRPTAPTTLYWDPKIPIQSFTGAQVSQTTKLGPDDRV